MNTSLQLYNASLSPNMCPLWPEIPALESALVTQTARTNSIFERIHDYMPKTWDELLPHLIHIGMAKECIVNAPLSRVSTLATLALPAKQSDPNPFISQSYRPLLRYFAYKLGFQSKFQFLLPCILGNDGRSCAKFLIYGVGSEGLKLIEKGETPGLLSSALFIFKHAIYAKGVDAAVSCLSQSPEKCIIDTVQLAAGVIWHNYCSQEL